MWSKLRSRVLGALLRPSVTLDISVRRERITQLARHEARGASTVQHFAACRSDDNALHRPSASSSAWDPRKYPLHNKASESHKSPTLPLLLHHSLTAVRHYIASTVARSQSRRPTPRRRRGSDHNNPAAGDGQSPGIGEPTCPVGPPSLAQRVLLTEGLRVQITQTKRLQNHHCSTDEGPWIRRVPKNSSITLYTLKPGWTDRAAGDGGADGRRVRD
ncbi:hypothetical protein C8Q73DRAFT_134063 [Cubamyces lactineus]|nr:hypothetical protein C8Q73DRAFT_134063 [Cubamyces lactineus]